MIITLQALIFFRKSLLETIDRLLRPYYSNFFFPAIDSKSDDEETDEQVFAEYDDQKGVVFFPPVYTQRYAAVSDCLMDGRWCGKLEKVVDMGCNDASFIKYLKEIPGIQTILCVDIECTTPLRCSSDLLKCRDSDTKREDPLQIILFQGNAADPDYHLIGCDGVVAIEMIEHMLPHDLERLVHNIFGFIRPWVVVITTPNADFNVLFKSLESNGLRRLDHFFEWTREQFHDWCSNIVTRYPQYTVSCKGIGPGPMGTEHLGCCSQLGLFIAKHYEKQQDQNVNSLALVADLADATKSDLTAWDDSENLPDNVPEFPTINESIPDLIYSNEQSSVAIVLSSSSRFDNDVTSYCDKTSQCDIDVETQRNYLMFNDEDLCFKTLIPRKINDENKVYLMEDVKCRLNSSTLHVKRFSKTTQNILDKNQIDSPMNTKEVVAKIKQLAKTLNFDKNTINTPNGRHTIWSNINWGDNAPYWNQYYRTVKEYEYPLEATTDEHRVLDLLTAEIHRLIDVQENKTCVGQTEIPISQLMRAVEHITSDVDKVKDILEWNGYEIVDNVVVHSSLVFEDSPLDDAVCNVKKKIFTL